MASTGKTAAKYDGRIVLSTPVTYSDWVWKYEKQIGHGERAVHRIVERCRDAGWTRLYWRCLDGGQSLYRSKLMENASTGYVPDNYHAWASPGEADKVLAFLKRYPKNLDTLAPAVEHGHKLGVEVHAWLSINEDDHAWGLPSLFTRTHPHCRWVKRAGIPYNSQLSFAFPEVREYKLGIVKEILRYDVDGVFFDWIRTGDIRNNPQATPCGTADFGYEKPLVEGFKKKYRLDPRQIPNRDERWVRFRAEPQTAFMRDAARLIRRKGKHLPISVMGHHAWGYRGNYDWVNGCLYGLLLDVGCWAKEKVINEIVGAGYYMKGGTPEKAHRNMTDQVKGRCPVWTYEWVPGCAEDVAKGLRRARKLRAPQILYWESDYIGPADTDPKARARTAAMHAHAHG